MVLVKDMVRGLAQTVKEQMNNGIERRGTEQGGIKANPYE
jgi:hypothetical protein